MTAESVSLKRFLIQIDLSAPAERERERKNRETLLFLNPSLRTPQGPIHDMTLFHEISDKRIIIGSFKKSRT